MALALTVDNIEDIPETVRGAYVEKDGKFHLDVEIEDSTPLKTRLSLEQGNRAALEKKMKAWAALGKTPEEIAELLQTIASQEEENAKKSGNFEKLLQQHQAKAATEKDALVAELNAARTSERSAVVGERVQGQLAKLGATEEGIELLPDRLASRIKFETVNGVRKLTIMQADGDTPMAGTAQDGTATLEDLVKEAQKKYPSLFKGNNSGGGGKLANDRQNSATPGSVARKSDFKTEKDRAAYVTANGMAAYKALPN